MLVIGCASPRGSDGEAESKVQRASDVCAIAFEPPQAPLPGGARRADDVDGDGHADLVGIRERTLSVLRGDGKGRFSEVVSDLGPGQAVVDYAIGDVDGDGRRDLVTLDASSVAIFAGIGEGRVGDRARVFTPTAREVGESLGKELSPLGKVSVVDGKVLVTTRFRRQDSTSGGLFVLASKADGQLTASGHLTYEVNADGAFAVDDFDGDGRSDLLVVNNAHAQNASSLWSAGSGDGGEGGAAFVLRAQGLATAGATVTRGDFDGDRRADVVIRGTSPGAPLAFYAGDGRGGFSQDVTSPLQSDFPVHATLFSGDFDGDKRLDAALAADGFAEIHCAMGSRLVARSKAFDFGAGVEITGQADFDEDGRTDLVMMGRLAGQVGPFVALARQGVDPPDSGPPPDAEKPADADSLGDTASIPAPILDAAVEGAAPPGIDPVLADAAPEENPAQRSQRRGWKELPVKPAEDGPTEEGGAGCSSSPVSPGFGAYAVAAALLTVVRKVRRRDAERRRRTRS